MIYIALALIEFGAQVKSHFTHPNMLLIRAASTSDAAPLLTELVISQNWCKVGAVQMVGKKRINPRGSEKLRPRLETNQERYLHGT